MRRNSNAGFTLLEIMVVVCIIGVLVALIAPQMMSRRDIAQVIAAKTEIKSLQQAIRTFKLDNGRLPTSAEGLSVLVPPPPTDLKNYDPDGYMEQIPTDPWEHPYVYTTDGRHFEITCYGRDGAPGGEGYDADLNARG
jgi:general secretion pathway protein G